MATITRDDVLSVAPEFDAIPVGHADWTYFPSLAAKRVADGIFADNDEAKHATALMCAHLLTLLRPSIAGGSTAGLKSITVGPVTKVFDTSTGSGSALDDTSYGRAFRALCQLRGPTFVTT